MDNQPKNQKELTEQYILPHADKIIEDIIAIRTDIIDVQLIADPKVQQLLAYWRKEYPIGLCAQIRNAMLDQIFDPANAVRYAGIGQLMEFVRAGGQIIPFWGVDKDQYFENAILIGDAVLDVANDTVYTYKNPVEFYPSLDTSPLKLIPSFTKVAEVAEAYWHQEIYPNIYFPELAPLFPIIAIVNTRDHDGQPVRGVLIMGDFIDLHPRNIQTIANGYACGLAYDFFTHGTYRTKRLPENILNALNTQHALQHFTDAEQELLRFTTNPQEVLAVFEQYKIPSETNGISPELLKKIKTLEHVGNRIKGVILVTVPV